MRGGAQTEDLWAFVQRSSLGKELPRETRPVRKRTRPLITSSFFCCCLHYGVDPARLADSALALAPASTSSRLRLVSLFVSLFSLGACVYVGERAVINSLRAVSVARARARERLVHARPPARLRLSHRRGRAEAGADRYEPD